MQQSIVLAFVLLASSNAELTQDVAMLQKWSLRLASAVHRMRNQELCADSQLLGLGPQYSVHQNVQRFGRFDQAFVQDDKDAKGIAMLLATESQEVELKHKQLELMIASLQGHTTHENQFDDAEVQAMVTRARHVLSDDRDGSVQLTRVSAPLLMLQAPNSQACVQATLVKPLLMYRDPLVALPQSAANSSVPLALPEVSLRQQSLSEMDEDEDQQKAKAWQKALNHYAANHTSVVSAWALCPCSEMCMMPCSGSGPEMPLADSHLGPLNCYCQPQVGSIYVQQDDVLDSDPCGGLSYFNSCEFGPFTRCDLERQQNWLWMVPIFGDFLGICPARQIPGRTCCGSHPSQGSCHGERMEDYLEDYDNGTSSQHETHLSYTSSAYDKDLVPLLYKLHMQNARFQRVTFRTTTLTQLAAIGVQPSSVHYQHWGVELTLAPDSPGLPLLRDVTRQEARVLSVEMMSEGLLWSLKQHEMPLDEVQSSESFAFDNLPVNLVADFLFERRGMTYKDENCQQFARNLMDRILVYGQLPRAVSKYVDETPLLTWRAYFIAGLALLPITTYFILFLTFLSLLLKEFREGCEGPAIKIVHALRRLDESLRAGEEKGQRYIGKRASFLARLGLAMYFQPLAFMYVYNVGCAVNCRFKGRNIDVAEPLLAS